MAVLWNKQLKELVWKVVSTSMNNTIVVSVPVVVMHPIYKKRYTKFKKCYAHVTDTQECILWDRVKIRQSKPISKLKRRSFIEKVS